MDIVVESIGLLVKDSLSFVGLVSDDFQTRLIREWDFVSYDIHYRTHPKGAHLNDAFGRVIKKGDVITLNILDRSPSQHELVPTITLYNDAKYRIDPIQDCGIAISILLLYSYQIFRFLT